MNNKVVIHKYKKNDNTISMRLGQEVAQEAALPKFFLQFKDLTVSKRLLNAVCSLGSKKKLEHRIADFFFWFRIRKQDARRVYKKGISMLQDTAMNKTE